MNQGVSQIADSIAQRIPPQNEEAEEAVLGAMLISPDSIGAVTELVHAGDFYKPSHGQIFKTALTLYGRGDPAASASPSWRRSPPRPPTRRTTPGSCARWRRCAV